MPFSRMKTPLYVLISAVYKAIGTNFHFSDSLGRTTTCAYKHHQQSLYSWQSNTLCRRAKPGFVQEFCPISRLQNNWCLFETIDNAVWCGSFCNGQVLTYTKFAEQILSKYDWTQTVELIFSKSAEEDWGEDPTNRFQVLKGAKKTRRGELKYFIMLK